MDEERARLPLTFLFQRNLGLNLYCKEKGVAIITHIFAKLQHQLLFSAFERWHIFNETARKAERRVTVFKQSQARALALLQRLASDVYVGTMDRGFDKWRRTVREMVESERHTAVSVIQLAFRKRRARKLASVLKQAAQDAAYRRGIEIQQLLRFESYGTTMLWSSLHLGFNLLLQNHCSRRIQFFFRRLVVNKRVDRRLARRQAATKIQAAWRMYKAKVQLFELKAERDRRRELEAASARTIQRQVRLCLAKRHLHRLREQRALQTQNAATIQQWWRRRWQRWTLQLRFDARRRLLLEERLRQDRVAYEIFMEKRRKQAVADIQRVARGWFGRQEYRRELQLKRLTLAARRVQASWRKSKGRYALHLRFMAQGTRLEERRTRATLRIQGCYRMFAARKVRSALKFERDRRHFAAVAIQCSVRRRQAVQAYQHKRRSTITIQRGARHKLQRIHRQREADERVRRFTAAVRIQCWTRCTAACRHVRSLREQQRQEAERRRQSAIQIQKYARGVEVRRMLNLLRVAIATVELEQSRHYRDSSRPATSELLDFVTAHYFVNPQVVGSQLFTTDEYTWLQTQVELTKAQMVKEDRAIVFLQRYYRGYACRAAFWARKVRDQQRQAFENRSAVVLQRVARGFLARRRVRRLRQKQKLDELKAQYVQEQRWKQMKEQWKEQFQREQLELQIRRAKKLEMKAVHAKREAEIAKFEAEAARYRSQERRTRQDDHHHDKASDTGSKQWEQLVDEYGNAYYFNIETGESSWELPPELTVETTTAEEAPALEEETEEKRTEPEAPAEPAPVVIDEDIKPTAEVQNGLCGVCKTARATKQCTDCLEPTLPVFCTPCFMHEHHGALAAASKRSHDFKVLVKTENPSRCQSSFNCSDAEMLPTRRLATYYCYECPGHTDAASAGVFYCDECFKRGHETAQVLPHVATALHFKTGASLCSECNAVVAVRHCEQCDERFCGPCFDRIHSNSRAKRDHSFELVEIVKEELQSDKDAYCVECDVRRCDRLCNLCGDGFCAQCFALAHAKGAKQGHTWVAWASFAQQGDWLEIWDDKAQAKVFFNLETKESTSKQPLVLKSGAERHQVQLAEREQQFKRRQLELESEVIKLKEQLQELQDKDKPLMSRTLAAASADASPQVAKPDAKEPSNNKKKGFFGRLYSRPKQKKPQGPPLTEQEKKRLELVDGVSPNERELILAKMKTRARLEKEDKARGTVGTALFQQTMVDELAHGK